MNTVPTAQAPLAAPSPAVTPKPEWATPEARDFDTSMEVTAYAGRR